MANFRWFKKWLTTAYKTFAAEVERYEEMNVKIVLLSAVLLSMALNVAANDVKYFGPNAVIPDAVQKDMIAASIDALIQDCAVATKISRNEIRRIKRGLEVNYSNPVTFNSPPAGKVSNINKVVVSLWDNAEESYGMDIYAFSDSEVFLLGKYKHLSYPIINMIIRPMPPNNRSQPTSRISDPGH